MCLWLDYYKFLLLKTIIFIIPTICITASISAIRYEISILYWENTEISQKIFTQFLGNKINR